MRKHSTAWEYLQDCKKQEESRTNKRIAFWTIISFIIFLSVMFNCVGGTDVV